MECQQDSVTYSDKTITSSVFFMMVEDTSYLALGGRILKSRLRGLCRRILFLLRRNGFAGLNRRGVDGHF